jgi:hypothetical protein
MTKRMTKKEMFAVIAETINAVEVENKAEMLNFIDHEIELLEKKSSKSGQTKTQKENELLKAELLTALGEMDKPVTISEFCERTSHPVGKLSNQKLSALLNQMVKAETVVKTVEKKKSYFAVA